MSHVDASQKLAVCPISKVNRCQWPQEFESTKYKFNIRAGIILHTLELEAAMVVVNLGGMSVMTCWIRVRDIRELGLPPVTHQYFRPLLCDLWHSALGLCKHCLTTTTSLAGQCYSSADITVLQCILEHTHSLSSAVYCLRHSLCIPWKELVVSWHRRSRRN